ncbi:hypothetical protein ACFC63_07230 [Streptomyces albidoflavus]
MFREAQFFGALRSGGQGMETLEFLHQRGRKAWKLFQVLEREAGARFHASVRLPFMLNASFVDDRLPLSAGYTADHGVLPSVWLASMHMSWHETFGPPGAPSERFRTTRSALWVLQHTGLREVLHYIVDLVEYGLIADPVQAAQAGARIISHHSTEGDPANTIRRLLGKTPTCDDDWLGPAHGNTDSGPPPPLSRQGSRALQSLFARSWELVANVRNASCLSEWLLHIGRLQRVITCTTVIARLLLGKSLAADALIRPLQEVDADCESAVAMTWLYGSCEPFVIAHRILREDLRAVGDPSGERFQRERCLLPRAVLDDGPTGDWNKVEWSVSIPWQMLAVPPGRRWTEKASEDLDKCRAIFDRALGKAQHLRSSAGTQGVLRELLEEFPWFSPAHYVMAMELGMDLRFAPALEHAQAAAFLDPEITRHWETLAVILRIRDADAASVATAIGRCLAA